MKTEILKEVDLKYGIVHSEKAVVLKPFLFGLRSHNLNSSWSHFARTRGLE
jgi:hypothetical protein